MFDYRRTFTDLSSLCSRHRYCVTAMFSAPQFRRGRRRRWGELFAKIGGGLLFVLTIGPMLGCRTVAPIHLWQPPQIR